MPKGPQKPDQSAGGPPIRKVQGTKVTQAEKNAFCRELAKHGVFAWASRAVGRANGTMIHLRDRDLAFAEQIQEAQTEADARIEHAAIQRSVEGVERFEVSAGQVVKDDDGNPVTRREFSDSLLLAVLRARDQRFRTKQSIDVNHSHNSGGANISTDDIFLLEEDDRDQFLHLLSKIEARRRGDQSQPQLENHAEDAEFSDVAGEELDEDEDAALAAIL